MHRLANPSRFLKLAEAVQPWVATASVLLLAAGVYLALVGSPADYQQGQSVRIMYVHVPSAWLGMLGYSVMAAASAVGLIWKHPLAEVMARSVAPIGAAFTFVCLATGSLWGKPMWGTWWAWDARLTSMLILLFLYLGYMALANAFDDPARGGKAASILALAGFVNVPIIKFSVDWWHTLHQPASVMVLGFSGFFLTILLVRMRAELLAAKIRALRLVHVHTAPVA
jgi:heme exporter protein C